MNLLQNEISPFVYVWGFVAIIVTLSYLFTKDKKEKEKLETKMFVIAIMIMLSQILHEIRM